MKKGNSGFRTQSSYERESDVSGSMEDYLEMTLRLSPLGEPVRVSQLSSALNVSPSSASKMAAAMDSRGLVSFEKYGYIFLTASGRDYGSWLIRRHDAVNSLLCMINNSTDELCETEKIEHYLSRKTVENIEAFVKSKRGSVDE